MLTLMLVQVQLERFENIGPGEKVDTHFDAGAGVAVPPAPHAHLQVGCPGKPS